MRDRKPAGNMLWAVLFFFAAIFGFNACSDVNNVSGPPGPGPLTILTSSPLPAGTTGVAYDITLASSGGTAPYTWSLTPGSPPLPNGLVLNPSTGNILGTPTATGTTPTEFMLQDSKGQSVQKVLSITVNASPTPLTILTNSLPAGTINLPYATALGGTGGTTPYTWGRKSGSTPLPDGLSLDSITGAITGTPTVTSSATHVFTLQDITSFTVEKSLTLTISAVPLSITTPSPLPQGTAGQSYSETLAASGGTGNYTWGFAGGSQPLPDGLTLHPSTGLINGIPTSPSNSNITFTVTDQTPPTPQTATKGLQLIIGAAPPPPTITPNSLPSGSVLQSYTFALTTSGGTGALTWDLASGSLPVGLNLSSAGVISGTPTTAGTSSPTFRVRDSGNPQQSATKQLSITINLPAAPHITTSSLPPGSFNGAYNQTVSVTGGFGTLVWGVTSGGLPPGLNLNTSNGNISGTPTSTGPFTFTLRVTDSIPQFDEQILTITINPPAPPTITAPASASLPTGTVNQAYPPTTLTASGGTAPLTWDPVVSPALPNGLLWDADTHTISGIPLNGSQGTADHTFTVRDSTNPVLTATRTYSLTINLPAPPSITTTSPLPNGTVASAYSQTVVASGGTGSLIWSTTGSLPTGLNPINPSTGQISGTPSAAGTFNFTVRATDTLNQFDDKPLSITIGLPAPPNITTTTPLPSGTVGQAYSETVLATGGTGALTWSLLSGALPTGLDPIDPSTGLISGTPTVAGTFTFTVQVTDTIPQSDTRVLSITIDAALTITTTSLPNGTVGLAYNQPLQASGGTPP